MRLEWPRPLALGALLVWSAAVAWLMLSRRVTDLPLASSGYVNNLGHAVVFGVEALLLGAVLRPGPIGRPARVWAWAAAGALAYSGLLEWAQGSVAGRMSSLDDMLTNAIGAFGAPWALCAGSASVGRVALVVALAAGSAALATWG